MLNENLKKLRKAKGLSQEELAIKLHVVRQTVSKWEKGLSVPDSEMLIKLAEALDTSVSTLLGEGVDAPEAQTLQAIATKLELLNEQFSMQAKRRKRTWCIIFAAVGCFAAVVLLIEMIGLISAICIALAPNEGIGIIGGADGPTAILVSTFFFRNSPGIAALIVLVVCIVGFIKTK